MQKFLIIPLLFLIFFSCDKQNSINLALVNGEEIGMKSFIPRYSSFLLKTHQKDNLKNRFAFLNSMIDEKLILDHAKDKGINNDPNIVLERKKIYDQLLLNEYHEKNIIEKIEISERELRKLFKYSKTKIHVRHLFSSQLSSIKNIEEQILIGIPWENIAKECFQDSILKNNGGDIGWYKMGELEPAFELAAFELEDKEISSPVKTSNGYSIIQVIDREKDLLITENDYQLSKDWIKNMLIRYKQIPSMRKFTDDIINNLEIQFSEPGLKKLMAEIEITDERGLTNDSALVLKSIIGNWSVKRSQTEILSLSSKQYDRINSSDNLKKILSGLLARSWMLSDAKNLFLYKSESFQHTLNQEYTSLILRHLTKNHELGPNKVNWQDEYFKIRDEIAIEYEISIDSTNLKSFHMIKEPV